MLEIARRHDLFVVEDCAVALGAHVDGTHVGLLGDVGCFSFYPVKHITTGEGGMVITTRDDIADRVVEAARVRHRQERARRPPPHRRVRDRARSGFNYRLGEIGAAIGVEQMKRLPGFLEQRERNFELLAEGLGEIDELRVLDVRPRRRAAREPLLPVAVLDEGLAERRERDHRGAEGRRRRHERLLSQGAARHPLLPRNATATSTGHAPWRRRSATARSRSRSGPHVEEGDVERIVETVKASWRR